MNRQFLQYIVKTDEIDHGIENGIGTAAGKVAEGLLLDEALEGLMKKIYDPYYYMSCGG